MRVPKIQKTGLWERHQNTWICGSLNFLPLSPSHTKSLSYFPSLHYGCQGTRLRRLIFVTAPTKRSSLVKWTQPSLFPKRARKLLREMPMVTDYISQFLQILSLPIDDWHGLLGIWVCRSDGFVEMKRWFGIDWSKGLI